MKLVSAKAPQMVFLTHFKPMLHFYIRENVRKPSVSSGYRKTTLGQNGLPENKQTTRSISEKGQVTPFHLKNKQKKAFADQILLGVMLYIF